MNFVDERLTKGAVGAFDKLKNAQIEVVYEDGEPKLGFYWSEDFKEKRLNLIKNWYAFQYNTNLNEIDIEIAEFEYSNFMSKSFRLHII